MRKTFRLAAFLFVLASCRKDEKIAPPPPPPPVETQNEYDNLAAKAFLERHYLDQKGNIRPLSPEGSETKLSEMNPVTLPSGVIYLVNKEAKPNGRKVEPNDILRIQFHSKSYIARKTENQPNFQDALVFNTTLQGTGVPKEDPEWYHVTDKVINDGPSKDRDYYEVRGFKEAITNFLSYDNLPDSEDYHLQGVIIVPSREAFARRPHYNYTQYSLHDRSIVFNFQIYGASTRPK